MVILLYVLLLAAVAENAEKCPEANRNDVLKRPFVRLDLNKRSL